MRGRVFKAWGARRSTQDHEENRWPAQSWRQRPPVLTPLKRTPRRGAAYQLIFTIVLLTSAPALADEQPLRFGITDTRPAPHACATFQGSELRSGQRLYFLAFDPKRWVRGQVVGKRTSACKEAVYIEGAAYDVQFEQAEEVQQELGIAVVAPEGAPVVESGQARFIIRAGDQAISFRYCTGSEGIHFLAWRGNKRLWHEYYSLPYDIEPSCSEEELKEKER